LLFAENHKTPKLAFGPKSIAIRQNKCGPSHKEKTQMKQNLTVKQSCKTCKKEAYGREYFLFELYEDLCGILDDRGLLQIEMDNYYLPGLIETYWDHFYEYLKESERDILSTESQKLSDSERFDIYRWARVDKRTSGFECTNCIISKTPHP
jgi:hypothetical protein